jgi:hypothetical protein
MYTRNFHCGLISDFVVGRETWVASISRVEAEIVEGLDRHGLPVPEEWSRVFG